MRFASQAVISCSPHSPEATDSTARSASSTLGLTAQVHPLISMNSRVAARLELLQLVWSRELLSEAKQTLMQRKGLSADTAQRWVDYLTANFPEGETDITQALKSAQRSPLTSDPDDLHVCALAIASGSKYLFTHDRGYLHDRLSRHGIEVTDPDPFLASLEDQPEAMLERLMLLCGPFHVDQQGTGGLDGEAVWFGGDCR